MSAIQPAELCEPRVNVPKILGSLRTAQTQSKDPQPNDPQPKDQCWMCFGYMGITRDKLEVLLIASERNGDAMAGVRAMNM